MTAQQISSYGTVTEPGAVRMERLLPGPIERVWRYLTDAELRRTWLAGGEMTQGAGGAVELIFRNSEFTDADDPAPPQYSNEHRIQGEVLACEPPRLLSFTWGDGSVVTFTLEQVGEQVRLELTHRKLPDRDALLSVSGGWHSHLDLLVARLTGSTPEPFWPKHARLAAEYAERIPE
ncbi:SRPBCC family protein [Nocardia lijiangensis]|uniref:SRPBCC family protein n=1 Tax=Nocardia lijiangensis TaxID=299618 RepID=UPI00082F8210|nr:SRPBCC family protein [Nocardia lijiangensis]